MKNSNFTHQKGMTLIELMVSTVILAILVGVAVPSMKSLLDRKNIESVGDFFVKTIKLARTEAIQRSAVVRVKPKFANGNDWSQGWYFEYTNPDGVNEIIRKFDGLSGNPTFGSNEFNQLTPLIIMPNGQVNTRGTFFLNYPDDCNAGSFFYQVLLSGALQKGIVPC